MIFVQKFHPTDDLHPNTEAIPSDGNEQTAPIKLMENEASRLSVIVYLSYFSVFYKHKENTQ